MHLITQMKPGRKIKLKFIEDFLIFGYNKLMVRPWSVGGP